MAQDQTLQQFLQSEEFLGLAPEARSQLVQKFQKMSPRQQQQIVEALTPLKASQSFDVAQIEPTQGSGAKFLEQEGWKEPPVSRARQMGSLVPMAIDMTGQIGGAALGGMVGAPLTGEVAGSYLANQTNKALGFREGAPFTSFNTGDLLSVGVPTAVRVLAGALKGTTKPAQRALQTADDLNAENMGKYNQEVSNFDTAVQSHQEALDTVPAEAKRAIKVGNYRADYAAAELAGRRAQPVDLTEFQDVAAGLGINLRKPADPLQAKKYVQLAEALSDFGAAEPPKAVTSPILDHLGRPLTTMAEGKEAGESISRVIATHNKLGRLVGKLQKSGGEELGASKELYASLTETLQQAAERDPAVRDAVTSYLQAQAGYRKSLAMQDYMKLFDVKRGYTIKPGIGNEVKTANILANFEDLVQHNRFFKGSFTDDELRFLEENLQKLPTTKIPRRPGAPPEMVEPQLEGFPWGKAIMAKTAGAMAGGLLGEKFGIGTYPGIVAGSAAGAGVVALPYFVSKGLMSHPMGQQIVRNVMAGKQTLGPKELAVLTAVAKHLGIPTEEPQ